jgi:hypothetical protein
MTEKAERLEKAERKIGIASVDDSVHFSALSALSAFSALP